MDTRADFAGASDRARNLTLRAIRQPLARAETEYTRGASQSRAPRENIRCRIDREDLIMKPSRHSKIQFSQRLFTKAVCPCRAPARRDELARSCRNPIRHRKRKYILELIGQVASHGRL
eukprot:774554-Prorocentrum_minimum.AAC.3